MNHNKRSSPDLPVPELEPQGITLDEFWTIADDKFEYVEGFLFEPPETNSTRDRLLSFLLRNQGLLRAVQMAPRELWEEALTRVYGSGT